MTPRQFIRKARSLFNRLRKSISGQSLSDKLKCLLICFKFESRAFANIATRFLDAFAKNSILTITLRHQKTQKLCTISLREKNYADYFIFWEFLGGFYNPPDFAERIVDCGANIGLFAVHAGLIFPRAKIICFEPDRKNFEMLLKNLEQNNIKADCLQRGVWSSKLSGYFHCRQAFDGFISLDPSEFPVECEVPEISFQTWLKMDIEGGEYEVLPTIMSSDILPTYISMEIHDFHVRGESLTTLMISSGYELHVVTDGSSKALFAEVSAKLADSRL